MRATRAPRLEARACGDGKNSPSRPAHRRRGERLELDAPLTPCSVELREIFVAGAVHRNARCSVPTFRERRGKLRRRLERGDAIAALGERKRLAPPSSTADEDVSRRLREEAANRLLLPGEQIRAKRRLVGSVRAFAGVGDVVESVEDRVRGQSGDELRADQIGHPVQPVEHSREKEGSRRKRCEQRSAPPTRASSSLPTSSHSDVRSSILAFARIRRHSRKPGIAQRASQNGR